jgi:hypothetical protein
MGQKIDTQKAKPYSACVLGSSHSACVKNAWSHRDLGTAQGFSMTFFAAKSVSLRQLDYRDGALVPNNPKLAEMLELTSGGLNRIEIGKYDAFVLIALNFAADLPEICERYRVISQPSTEPDQRWLLSRACFQALIASELRRSLAIELARKLRALTDRPILICPKPFPAVSIVAPGPECDPAALGPAFALYVAAATQVAEENGAEMVWPPAETMVVPGFTKRQYAEGGLRMQGKQSDKTQADGKHMNEDYGALVCDSVLRKLDELSDGNVLTKAPARILQHGFQ